MRFLFVEHRIELLFMLVMLRTPQYYTRNFQRKNKNFFTFKRNNKIVKNQIES